jgi:alkylhydroperoxidase family enzyme
MVPLKDAMGVAAAVFADRLATTGTVPDAVRVLANAPRVAQAQDEYLKALNEALTLAPRTRELVIMAAAVACHSDYEWAHHWGRAVSTGNAPDSLLRLGDRTSGSLEPLEAAVVDYVRCLCARAPGLSDSRTVLIEYVGPKIYVEITVLASFYAGTSLSLNALGVALEHDGYDDVPPMPTSTW